MREDNLNLLLRYGVDEMKEYDSEIYSILDEEILRQREELLMVASCSMTYPSALVCQGSITNNVTAEGYPYKRYHAGCSQIDRIETLAIDRAKRVFGARYVNVQPHSATTANEIVMFSLLKPGDKILGLKLNEGGHLSHGSSVSYSGIYFQSIKYSLNDKHLIDYDMIEEIAIRERPKLIVCGTTAYSRQIDFRRYRDIADKVNAYLLADISHISGLVVAGLHPSPIDFAHVTTTCTHKQLFGPRGGLIMLGKDANMKLFDGEITLEKHFQKAVFPFFQGAPLPGMIAAKALALKMAERDEFKDIMNRIVENARNLAVELSKRGYKIISGGTDTHIVLVDLQNIGITGDIAEKALEQCGIIVNKNSVPNAKSIFNKRPMGIRIGTNSLSQRGFGEKEIKICAGLIDDVLKHVTILGDKVIIENKVKENTRMAVKNLCQKFPIRGYY